MEKEATNAVWWRGALKGALQGIPLGIVIGVAAAALLAFVAIPLVPSLAPVVGSFLSFSGAPELLTIPTTTVPFFPVPLLFFNTAITVAANFISGGNLAVAQHRQQIDHAQNEARIQALESRELAIEQSLTTSKTLQNIVAQGPRAVQSFADAEVQRSSASAPTLH